MSVINPSTFTILTYRAFEPTEISGLKAWYKADSIAQADGSSVSAWLDSSGNEAHMYQSTSAAQPTYQTNELNGLPVVRFDGTDDFMNLTAPFNVLPTNVSGINSNSFSNNGQYFLHSNASTTPLFFLYKKNGNNFSLLSNPSIMPTGTVYQSTWMTDDSYFAIGSNVSPRIQIYKRTNDSFSKISDPATIPNAAVLGCNFSSDGVYLATSGQMTGLMLVYKISGETYTALANPITVPAGTQAFGVKFSPDTSYLAIGSNNTPFIQIYSRSGDTFTKLNNPSTLPSAEIYSISWLDNSTFAICGNSSSVQIYTFDSGTGTFQQVTSFSSGVGTSTISLSYSKDKNYLIVVGNSTPYLKVFSRSGTTYTALSNPASLPLGTGRGVAWGANDNTIVVSHSTAPNIQAYTFDGTTLTNLTKLNMFRNVGGGTVFVVAKYALVSTYDVPFVASTGTSTTAYRIALGINDTANFFSGRRQLDADSSVGANSSQLANNTNYYIQTANFNFTNRTTTQYINNVIDGTSSGGGTAGNTSNTDSQMINLGRLFSSGYGSLNGDIAEVIAFNRTLTTAEIRDVHYYLSAKYNITLAT